MKKCRILQPQFEAVGLHLFPFSVDVVAWHIEIVTKSTSSSEQILIKVALRVGDRRQERDRSSGCRPARCRSRPTRPPPLVTHRSHSKHYVATHLQHAYKITNFNINIRNVLLLKQPLT